LFRNPSLFLLSSSSNSNLVSFRSILKEQHEETREAITGGIAVLRSENKLSNRVLNNKLDDQAQINEENRQMLQTLLAMRAGEIGGYASQERPPSAVIASNITAASSVSEEQVESRVSQYLVNPPSMNTNTDDDDSSTKENVSLQANNILKQQNAELTEQLAALKQAHASTVVEKEQLKREFQTIISPTRKRPEDVVPTPARQTTREKRAETQSINNSKTGRLMMLRSQSCLQSERGPTLRRSQRRL